MKKLKVLELFAGTRSIGKAFEKLGHEVFSVEWDEQHENIDWYADISKITAEDILERFGQPDVIWASPDCFTAGHLVKTIDGHKPIEEIKIGDQVLTHKNRYRKVYNTMNKKSDHIHLVKIAGTEEIEVTEEHPFLARKKIKKWNNSLRAYETNLGEPEWIKAKDLTKEYRVQKLINNDSTIPLWKGITYDHNNQFGNYKSKPINDLEKLLDDNDFWWLMGRYIGDGTNHHREDLRKYQFEICCSKLNGDVDILKKAFEKLPFTYSLSEKRTTFVFSVSKKELTSFVSQFGKNASGKFVPDFVHSLPVELLKSFLDGYLSADGTKHVDKNGRTQRLVTTVSEKLAYGMSSVLTKVYGIHPSLITVPPKDDHYIEGRKVNCRKQYILSWYENSKGFYTFDKDSVWVNVASNNRVEKDVDVYNISVEEDETYVVRNITVHNCTSYSIAAISHHRRKNEESGNLDPVSDYAKFSDELNLNMHKLIKDLNPTYYFIENPRGGMRKMTFVQDLPRYTVTYCQFGDSRMKPTDIWTNHPDPKFKPMCKNGAPCHVAAPRGSRTGTQGLKGSVERSVIPEQLCDHVAKICEEEYRVCDHSGEFILNEDGYFLYEDSGETFKNKEYAIQSLKEKGLLEEEVVELFSFKNNEPKVFWTQD